MRMSTPAIRMTFPHFGESFVARGQTPLQPLLWPCVRHHALALSYRKQALPRCSVHSLHEAKCPAIGRSPPQHSLREWSGCMRASASAIVVVSLDVCGTMPSHFIAEHQRTILILCCERNCSLTFLCHGLLCWPSMQQRMYGFYFRISTKMLFLAFFYFPSHIWGQVAYPNDFARSRENIFACLPKEACLVLSCETTFMCTPMRDCENEYRCTQHTLLCPTGHNTCP